MLARFFLMRSAGAVALAVSALAFMSRAGAQDPTDPSLPPVTVRPQPETQYYFRDDVYSDGSITWDSDLIFSDSQLVGPYRQPVWTTQRPWASTRAYVLPAGTAQVEQWVRPTWKRDKKVEYRMLEEVAIGLPGRFQLDIYERWNIEPNATDNLEANHEGVQIELRYALADWGEIFLNPTLYIEYIERGGPQEKPNKYEAKLLLAEQFGDQLFYASNFILEQETSGEYETELGWSNALSMPIFDRKLMAGVEMVLSSTNVQGSRGDHEVSFTIGPSVQWRPTNRSFVDVVGLFGTTEDSPAAQMYVIVGWQFGSRAGPSSNYPISGPAATRGN